MGRRAVWVHGNFNAAKCAKYLRSRGVEITPQQEAAWLAQEKAFRKGRRIVLRGKQTQCRTCGRIWQYVVGRRTKKATACPDCGGHDKREDWTLWLQYGDGDVVNTNAIAVGRHLKNVFGDGLEDLPI